MGTEINSSPRRSTIAQLIDRFRHASPSSPNIRRSPARVAELHSQFWWLDKTADDEVKYDQSSQYSDLNRMADVAKSKQSRAQNNDTQSTVETPSRVTGMSSITEPSWSRASFSDSLLMTVAALEDSGEHILGNESHLSVPEVDISASSTMDAMSAVASTIETAQTSSLRNHDLFARARRVIEESRRAMKTPSTHSKVSTPIKRPSSTTTSSRIPVLKSRISRGSPKHNSPLGDGTKTSKRDSNPWQPYSPHSVSPSATSKTRVHSRTANAQSPSSIHYNTHSTASKQDHHIQSSTSPSGLTSQFFTSTVMTNPKAKTTSATPTQSMAHQTKTGDVSHHVYSSSPSPSEISFSAEWSHEIISSPPSEIENLLSAHIPSSLEDTSNNEESVRKQLINDFSAKHLSTSGFAHSGSQVESHASQIKRDTSDDASINKSETDDHSKRVVDNMKVEPSSHVTQAIPEASKVNHMNNLLSSTHFKACETSTATFTDNKANHFNESASWSSVVLPSHSSPSTNGSESVKDSDQSEFSPSFEESIPELPISPKYMESPFDFRDDKHDLTPATSVLSNSTDVDNKSKVLDSNAQVNIQEDSSDSDTSTKNELDLYVDSATIDLEPPEVTVARLRRRLQRIDREYNEQHKRNLLNIIQGKSSFNPTMSSNSESTSQSSSFLKAQTFNHSIDTINESNARQTFLSTLAKYENNVDEYQKYDQPTSHLLESLHSSAPASVLASSYYPTPAPASLLASSYYPTPAPASVLASSYYPTPTPAPALTSSYYPTPAPTPVLTPSHFPTPAAAPVLTSSHLRESSNFPAPAPMLTNPNLPRSSPVAISSSWDSAVPNPGQQWIASTTSGSSWGGLLILPSGHHVLLPYVSPTLPSNFEVGAVQPNSSSLATSVIPDTKRRYPLIDNVEYRLANPAITGNASDVHIPYSALMRLPLTHTQTQTQNQAQTQTHAVCNGSVPDCKNYQTEPSSLGTRCSSDLVASYSFHNTGPQHTSALTLPTYHTFTSTELPDIPDLRNIGISKYPHAASWPSTMQVEASFNTTLPCLMDEPTRRLAPMLAAGSPSICVPAIASFAPLRPSFPVANEASGDSTQTGEALSDIEQPNVRNPTCPIGSSVTVPPALRKTLLQHKQRLQHQPSCLNLTFPPAVMGAEGTIPHASNLSHQTMALFGQSDAVERALTLSFTPFRDKISKAYAAQNDQRKDTTVNADCSMPVQYTCVKNSPKSMIGEFTDDTESTLNQLAITNAFQEPALADTPKHVMPEIRRSHPFRGSVNEISSTTSSDSLWVSHAKSHKEPVLTSMISFDVSSDDEDESMAHSGYSESPGVSPRKPYRFATQSTTPTITSSVDVVDDKKADISSRQDASVSFVTHVALQPEIDHVATSTSAARHSNGTFNTTSVVNLGSNNTPSMSCVADLESSNASTTSVATDMKSQHVATTVASAHLNSKNIADTRQQSSNSINIGYPPAPLPTMHTPRELGLLDDSLGSQHNTLTNNFPVSVEDSYTTSELLPKHSGTVLTNEISNIAVPSNVDLGVSAAAPKLQNTNRSQDELCIEPEKHLSNNYSHDKDKCLQGDTTCAAQMPIQAQQIFHSIQPSRFAPWDQSCDGTTRLNTNSSTSANSVCANIFSVSSKLNEAPSSYVVPRDTTSLPPKPFTSSHFTEKDCSNKSIIHQRTWNGIGDVGRRNVRSIPTAKALQSLRPPCTSNVGQISAKTLQYMPSIEAPLFYERSELSHDASNSFALLPTQYGAQISSSIIDDTATSAHPDLSRSTVQSRTNTPSSRNICLPSPESLKLDPQYRHLLERVAQVIPLSQSMSDHM